MVQSEQSQSNWNCILRNGSARSIATTDAIDYFSSRSNAYDSILHVKDISKGYQALKDPSDYRHD
jgi:hypothetical protein